MALFPLPPYFLDIRIWHELLAHHHTLCEREDELLRHLHTVMNLNGSPMSKHFSTNVHQLEDKNAKERTNRNLAITDYGIQFNTAQQQEEGLTSDQVEVAIIALARFHALSMKLPQICGPNSVIPYFSHPKNENKSAINKWLFNLLFTLPNCDYFRKNERPLRNFFQKVEFEFDDEKRKINADKDLPIVLCHGNFCGENIMFSQGEIPFAADNGPNIFSWELAYLGYGISDVAHLLMSSVNSSIRIQFLDKWVALYVHNFEQFGQIRKGGQKMGKKIANKNKIERIVKQQKEQFRASLPGQLIRVLPKLATEYRKLTEAEANSGKGCALLGRMIGGFEMIRKDFE